MKNLLMLLVNLCNFITICFTNFFGIIWYGKMPKVSVYHQNITPSCFSFKSIFEDPLIQSRYNCHEWNKYDGAKEYLDKVLSNPLFSANCLTIDIPIFDGKDIIGTQSVGGLLHDELDKMKKEAYK